MIADWSAMLGYRLYHHRMNRHMKAEKVCAMTCIPMARLRDIEAGRVEPSLNEIKSIVWTLRAPEWMIEWAQRSIKQSAINRQQKLVDVGY